MPGTQRRVACPHLEAGQYVAARCYCSEVSSSNLSTFVRRGHVQDDVELEDLRTWLGQADDADAVLAVCNACDRVLQVDGGEVVVRHPGEEARDEPPVRPDGGRVVADSAEACACCPQTATSEKFVLGVPDASGAVVAPLCDDCAGDRGGPMVYYADLPTGGDA